MQVLLERGEKRRNDVRALLPHSVRLDPSFARHLVGTATFPASVEATLRQLGAPPDCYVLAADPALDGRTMPVNAALGAVVGMGEGAFISCIPGRLGFYEYEDVKSSYLLVR